MKIPRLAAEHSIGPAFGEYATQPPGAAAATLVPMIGTVKMLDLNQPIEDIVKQRSQSQCGAAQRTCWGDPTRNKAYYYICCEDNQTCAYDNTGLPTCQ